jgi:hypothetical protein
MDNDIEIILSMNKHRVKALEEAQGTDICDILYDHLERLYDAAVPEEVIDRVEAQIEAELNESNPGFDADEDEDMGMQMH